MNPLPLPGGVWAVASGVRGPADARGWADSAAAADAWTFRLPACNEKEALAALRILAGGGKTLAVHARGDWARACQAAGVIAGSRSLPLPVLRRLFPGLACGASVHSLEEGARAVEEGADFLLFGPVWNTPSKEGILAARGTGLLARLCGKHRVPVAAIGGIRREAQVRECRAAGAYGVAVLRAARHPALLGSLVRAWREGINSSERES
ncbi:MAG: thiamine phosphate synthase [Planctomycetota bacterium]